MANTRFDPSISGPLHLGGCYMSLVNYHYAKASKGKFYTRFDDQHAPSLAGIGFERMTYMADVMQEQLTWLGIDGIYERESKLLPGIEQRIHELVDFVVPPPQQIYGSHEITPLWIGGHSLVYPYTPVLTLHKVFMDHDEGIDILIRGDELMTEVSLYCYYCDLLDWPKPRFVYLPRLRAGSGEISKTVGGFTLGEYMAQGYQPDDILVMLAVACLKNPANGWGLENIKDRPCL